MLSSEFTQEMGALIRRLEGRVRLEPTLRYDDIEDVRGDIENAIVTLCALNIQLGRLGDVRDVSDA